MSTYDFHTLSPMDFEILVRDLLKARLGIQLQAFAHGPDGGIDLKSSDNDKKTIVQCKHYRGSSFSALKSAAVNEKAKMNQENPDEYYFVTSQTLSLTQQETLVDILSPHLTDTRNIYSQLDLNELLADYPHVEANHFKLWMASTAVIREIVNRGIWNRSKALLEEIQDRVRLYVSTSSYQRAIEMLMDKQVCVVSGAPGVGKTMLADMLALAQWQDGWRIVELESSAIDRAWDVLDNFEDEKLFFYFDDVFGQTDVQERLGRDNGRTVARLIDAISRRPGKQLVITTRTHVLQEAELRDEAVSHAQLHARECIVEVDEYTREIRARILYNHLYFSCLSRETIREFVARRFYTSIIDHQNFTPRLIDLTIKHSNHGGTAEELHKRMMHALDHPMELWGPSFTEALSETARTLLMHLVTFPAGGAATSTVRASVASSSTPLELERALKQLDGSWIRIAGRGNRNETYTSFANPSCRDFVLSFINSHADYVMLLARAVLRPDQLAQLLRYAQSIDRDKSPKYPHLESKLRENAAQVAHAISDTWERNLGIQGTAPPDAPSILESLLGSSTHLELNIGDWVLDQILSLSTYSTYHSLDGYNCEELTQAIRESGRVPTTDAELESCKILFLIWCDVVGYQDEWHAVFEYRAWLDDEVEVNWTSDDESILVDRFSQWLQTEFDNVLPNAETESDADAYVREIRDVAAQYFDLASFSSQFQSIEHDIYEHFNRSFEPDLDYHREMYAAHTVSNSQQVIELDLTDEAYEAEEAPEPVEPQQRLAHTESNIDAMFDHLR
ncbi:restriction endonuclease [Mycobacterium sp. 360MFTsu5.1]|uniref:nSTAND3 domain-containing NTPase n=1 Tax=Mycobacterium sp. 360MFTsu5.1 TaxID=1172186 RepID=UPI0003A6990D|nr:restriction endonuclease [Mycobacterium sp. 360MFTsu5.1]